MVQRILGIVFWLGGALVVAALAIRFGVPAQAHNASYLAWGGLVCILLYALGQWRDIAHAFGRRQARYATMSAMSVLLVLGILAAINYIGAQQNKRWDLTAGQQFSLSDQSLNVLAKLDSPMHLMVFVQEQDFQLYRDRLREYEYASSHITTEYIDPDRQQALAQQHEIQQYGTILVNYEGRTERTTDNIEQSITNAIIKAVSGVERKVYFTQGHGEKDHTSSQRDGYNVIAEAFQLENYSVASVALAQTGTVPEDASVVIIAGPTVDFFPNEIDAIKTYLARAGKVLLLIDPPERPDSPPLTNLLALAREWNIEVGDDVVVDMSGMGSFIGTDASVPVVANYPIHPITDRFTVLTAFPLARSVSPGSGEVKGGYVQTFLESSPQSWAEHDLDRLVTSGEVAFDEGQDTRGPISLGVALSVHELEAETPQFEDHDAVPQEMRFAVIGDSDFASNAVLGIAGNRDLFMNTVGWLSQQENLISVRPREPEDRRLTLTAIQQRNMLWLSLAIIPGVIFGAGVYTWWRRR
jgi:ABC-type uncharacterized transport system involved in gliding motility auxiliary subunit